MHDTDEYKLVRRGGVRTSAQRAARGMSRTGRHAVSVDVLAPNIEECGQQPFAARELHALALRLQDPRWSRGTLSIFGLEGLLTALLVLPIGLRSAAWLPLVWNESGWKVPVALQGSDEFQPFIEALIGFMRWIDAGLLDTPPRFRSVLDAAATANLPKVLHPQQDWARGFGIAVSKSNYMTVLPNTIMHRMIYAIAMRAGPSSPTVRVHTQPSLQEAVLTLALARTSRGPLGPLPAIAGEFCRAPARQKKGA